MKGLGAIHDHIRIRALHHLGRGVEQGPGIPGMELLMGRLSPLLQDTRDLAGRDRLTIHRLDHEIVSLWCSDPTIPIPGDAFVDLKEPLPEPTDRSRCQMPQIPLRKLGVLARDPHFPSEGEIITNEDFAPGNEAGRVGLVVTVADANNPAVVSILTSRGIHLEDSEVSRTVMGQGVMFSGKMKPRRLELGLDFVDQSSVSQ